MLPLPKTSILWNSLPTDDCSLHTISSSSLQVNEPPFNTINLHLTHPRCDCIYDLALVAFIYFENNIGAISIWEAASLFVINSVHDSTFWDAFIIQRFVLLFLKTELTIHSNSLDERLIRNSDLYH